MEVFPEIDPTAYTWRQSKENQRQRRRRAVSSETNWLIKPRLFREMFISASVTLDTPITQTVLVRAVKEAWIDLRLDNPDIVAKPIIGEDNATIYIQHKTPESEDEVETWLRRTVFVGEPGAYELGFRDLRSKILTLKSELDTDQVFLLVHSTVEPDEPDIVAKLQLILNTDHRFTDGIGTRIILGKYLAHLAISLSGPALKDLNSDEIWQESARKLAPAWPTILNANQLAAGSEYQDAVRENKKNLAKLDNNPGIPLLPELDPPTQEFHFITLSQSQTTALLTAIKLKLYSGATVTHVGHAAMVLAMLRAHKLPTSNSDAMQSLHSPCWLNGRRYLVPYGDNRNPLSSYIPFLVSYSPIIFRNLRDLVVSPKASKAEVRDMLLKTCQIAGEEYRNLKEKKSVLPQMIVLAEAGREKRLQAFLSGPKKEGPSDHAREGLVADPYFVSDGITEQYITHEYFNASVERKRMFTVDNVTFAAHAEKTLIVRLSSWRNQLTVLGEWEGQYYKHGFIKQYLEDIVGIMMILIEEV